MGQQLLCQYHYKDEKESGEIDVDSQRDNNNNNNNNNNSKQIFVHSFKFARRKYKVKTSAGKNSQTIEKTMKNFHENQKRIDTINGMSNKRKDAGTNRDQLAQNDDYILSCERRRKPESMKNFREPQVFVLDRDIDNDEQKQILSTLTRHFLFKDITEDVLKIILNELIMYQFEENSVLYEENTNGVYFYILAKGKLKATSQNKATQILEPWTCFGELSLIQKSKREEAMICMTEVVLYVLDGEAFRDIIKRMNENRLKERFTFLNSVSFFKPLDSIYKYNITEKIEIMSYKENSKIIQFGDIGNALYIIKEGKVSCKLNNEEIRKLGPNDFFGQNALLIDAKRACDVYAASKVVVCYQLSKKALEEALGDKYKQIILFSIFREYISNHKYFKELFVESIMDDLFKCFQLKVYKENELINQTQYSNRRIIIIIEGNIYSKNCIEIIATKGDILGEELFNKSTLTLAKDIIAYPDLISLEANLSSLFELLKISSNQSLKPIRLLHRINNLKTIYLFKNLSDKTLESIAGKMQKKKYTSSQVIVQENTPGDTFYMITKGLVHVTQNNKFIRDLEHGSCFGEIALISQNEKRTATVTAKDGVTCYILSKADFEEICGEKTINEYLQKKLSLQDTSISLTDLYFLNHLGKGKFGIVNLVHNTKNIYAIKAIGRKDADKYKLLAKYFVSERRVMLTIDHPFIIKMVKTLKNDKFCFFLLEFINGKNLDEYLSVRKLKRNIDETRFYVASMLIMLDYLQKKQIVHRDIKPSNIMIDSNGYLKLIDFGTSRIMNDYTTTVIGTPYYIAPEILAGKGYSFSCDYWSVGVCMYEIFYGVYPFGNNASNVVEIYKEITHNKTFWLPNEQSKYSEVNQVIKELLRKKVNLRPCNISILKTYAFFTGFNWNDLIDFQLCPPYKPKVKSWKGNLITAAPFEEIMNEKETNKQNGWDEEACYDQGWAEEF